MRSSNPAPEVLWDTSLPAPLLPILGAQSWVLPWDSCSWGELRVPACKQTPSHFSVPSLCQSCSLLHSPAVTSALAVLLLHLRGRESRHGAC